MHIGRRAEQGALAEEGVLVDEHAGRGVDELQRAAGGRVIDQVLEEIGRAAEDRLGAEGALGRVEAAVLEHPHIVG